MFRMVERILLIGFLAAVVWLLGGCFGGPPRLPSGERLHAVALPSGEIIWLDEDLRVRHMAKLEKVEDLE